METKVLVFRLERDLASVGKLYPMKSRTKSNYIDTQWNVYLACNCILTSPSFSAGAFWIALPNRWWCNRRRRSTFRDSHCSWKTVVPMDVCISDIGHETWNVKSTEKNSLATTTRIAFLSLRRNINESRFTQSCCEKKSNSFSRNSISSFSFNVGKDISSMRTSSLGVKINSMISVRSGGSAISSHSDLTNDNLWILKNWEKIMRKESLFEKNQFSRNI